MGSPTTIHPFPELRALAEEEARAYHDACARIHPGYAAWDELPDYEATLTTDDPDYEGARLVGNPRRIFVKAHLTLLCDLTRPASRDAVARLVAARVDWRPSTLIVALDPGLFGVDVLFTRAGLPYDVNWPAAVKLAKLVRHLWPEEVPRG